MDEENLHPRPMALMKSLRLDAQSGSPSARELAVMVMVMVMDGADEAQAEAAGATLDVHMGGVIDCLRRALLTPGRTFRQGDHAAS